MNNTVAVVVTYNRKELLKQNLNCLLAQTHVCDVIVIDNASTDGTPEIEEIRNPNVIYHNPGSNLGGAGGFELGVRIAVEKGYDYVWVMDDDTLPDKNALIELLKADEALNGQWGWLSSVAYWTDGSICSANKQKKGLFHFLDSADYQLPSVKTQMASFVSLLLKSSIIIEKGLPIGEYFIWTDDYEFTGRISKSLPCYTIPSSKVTHAMKVHTKAKLSRDDINRSMRYHYLFRNDVHCYREYGLRGWSYIIIKDLYNLVDVLMHSKGNKIQKINIIWNGFKEGLSFHPEIHSVQTRQKKS